MLQSASSIQIPPEVEDFTDVCILKWLFEAVNKCIIHIIVSAVLLNISVTMCFLCVVSYC